jgi:YidC/Oxa1 family membrane protein insertase
MEKRLLIAIVLSFLVLFLYQAVFLKKEPPTEPVPITSEEVMEKTEQTKQPEKTTPIEEAETGPEEVEQDFQSISDTIESQITINTSLYSAVWSNKGATLRSWKLINYKNEQHEDLEIVSALSETLNRYPFFLNTGDESFDGMINQALFKSSRQSLNLTNGQSGEVKFEYSTESGIRVEKIFTFKDGDYTFDLDINVWKNGQKIDHRILWGPSIGNPTEKDLRRRLGGSSGVAIFTGGKVFRNSEKKFKPEKSLFNFVQWAAYEDQYFTAIFLTAPQKTSVAFLKEDTEQGSNYFLSVNYPEKVYIGPKDYDVLTQLGYQTKRLIKFGFFGSIAEILLRAIKLIHRAIPNWGICIIVLTLIIKILFFPLTLRSSQSMAKMQELQPKIKALKAKYKKAKQDITQRRKMNEETMKLYKEHGVNPAGGCLPLLIQMPIFWGFFRMLLVSIEFRQAPFIFWIKDLSWKDPLYITPILMGLTQYISQKMTPTSADPAQQRMMLIMPVIMTIFFMNFSSGLVLYWLTNNVLQIGQQYITNRLMAKKKREAHAKRRK